MTDPLRIRLGTRGSALARWQADWVAARLAELGVTVEMILIKTQGDVKSEPLGAIGGQGLFTNEIQRALTQREIDLAVHSLKDLPTDPVDGLTLAAVPERERPGDVLVSLKASSIEDLPKGARVGTGSLRRQAQLLHVRSDLAIAQIRGNVETRVAKLDEGQFDAIVLAEAGLRRLGMADRITQVIDKSIMLPAVGQGALGLETREDDARVREVLSQLDHRETHCAVVAERAMLATLRGGCLAPVGAWGRAEPDGTLHLSGVVLNADGTQRIEAAASGDPADASGIGETVADDLLAQGAGDLIASSRAGL